MTLCRQDGATVVLFDGVGMLRAGQSPLRQRKAAASLLYYMPFMTIPGLLHARQAYARAQQEVARRTGSLFVDIGDVVPADGTYFADANHYRDAGSFLAAQALAQTLIDAGIVGRSAKAAGRLSPQQD